MYPPSQTVNLNLESLSGICGSISIACWVVVFSPQIIENFRRSSAEGLSVVFILAWLLGDVFNILGAVLQGVLPTMIILAVYYTLADLVLLIQCFYYKGFTLRDDVPAVVSTQDPENRLSNEQAPLLRNGNLQSGITGLAIPDTCSQRQRSYSGQSIRERLLSIDGTHFSPVTPLHPDPEPTEPERSPVVQTIFQGVAFNSVIVLLVCVSGVFGWWLSSRGSTSGEDESDGEREQLSFNVLGQIFGYICAVLYLGSRIPQLLLNYRRKSTEGISMLFFLFACIGNLTYVLSIFAYSPQKACDEPGNCKSGEAGRMYVKYIAVNMSWILGSFGTLILDGGVFVQYFMYKPDYESEVSSFEESAIYDAPESEVRRERSRRRSIIFSD